jgi:iron complex outermembrane receptor protein/hemoglobin/transferrin/lactoferrin receptor protein
MNYHPYLLFFWLFLYQSAIAQTISGRVYDAETRQVVSGASVQLGGTSGAVTDARGLFAIEAPGAGMYQVQVSHVSYHSTYVPVTLTADSALTLVVTLKPSVIQLNNGVVVSAWRYQTSQFHTPEALTVLGGRELLQRSPRSTPEALMGATGVWVQKTNHGGGSPFIRGLTGQQTLQLIDGIRLNNATFRSGPNQYFNTIDPQSIASVEVLRGSGSVQYGSDALGGVIGVFTREPDFANKPTFGGTGYARYMSAGMEKSGRAELSYSSKQLAILGGFALRSFGDMLAGGKQGTLRPTGYDQLSGDFKARLQLRPNYLFTAAYQQVHLKEVPLYHRVQLENYEYSYFDPQKRQLAYTRLEAFYRSKWWRTVSLTLAWQGTEEGRISRRNEAPTITGEKDKVSTRSAVLLVSSAPATHWRAQSGMEYYYDKVSSRREDIQVATGAISPKRGLYPDGATSESLALFTLHSWQVNKLHLSAGGRFNTFVLTVPEAVLGTSTITPQALVGNVAVMYALHPHYHLTSSVNTAFRAPNIDDLGTLGIVDFRYELPNSRLQPEKSLNMEVGLKVKKERLAAAFSIYRSQLTDIISRVKSGNDSISGYRVYRKENQAQAYIQGAEGEAEWQLMQHLAMYTGFTYTYGQNKTSKEPFRRIPPLNARMGLYYQQKGFWSRLEYLAAAKQSRLAQADIADNRITDTGTPGWTILNLQAGYQYKWLLLSSEIHNLFNEAYRTHGSGVDGYGRSLWLSMRVQF